MRFYRSLFAIFVAVMSFSTFAKDYGGEINDIEKKVQESFGSNADLAAAMNAIAVAPIIRDMISHSPIGATLLLETDNQLAPLERQEHRQRILERLKTITDTPYELIHLSHLEVESRFSATKMRELLMQRLQQIVEDGKALQLAFVLPDLSESAGSLMTIKTIFQILDEHKFIFNDEGGKPKEHYLEDIEFIFFAESDHRHIPAAFAARMNSVATIDLNSCEPELLTEGK